jgi:hypothetical protein
MQFATRSVLVGFVLTMVSVASCSTGRNRASDTGPALEDAGSPEDGTGSVGIRFTLPNNNEKFSTFYYDLKNGWHEYSGQLSVGNSNVISFVLGGVAAGSGYSISLSGLSDDWMSVRGVTMRGVECDGSFGTGISNDFFGGHDFGAPFAVVARQSTIVDVEMVCRDLPNAQQGGLLVNGIPSCCPIWDTVVANPQGPLATTAPGNSTTLTGHASGPCDGDGGAGSQLSCVWSIKAGTGAVAPTSADGMGSFLSTFTCPTVGEVDVVQFDCTDGPLPDGGSCPPSLTHGQINLVCGVPPPGCMGPGENGFAVPDSATGTCAGADPVTGNPLVNGGPDVLGDFCCVAACGGGKVAVPFSASGSCQLGFVNDGTGCCVKQPPCAQSGESRIVANPDTATGVCTYTDPISGRPYVNPGTADVLGDFCCVPACPGKPFASPFSSTGTCQFGYVNDGTGCCVLSPNCQAPGENGVANPNTASGTCSGTDPLTGNPLVNAAIPDPSKNFCCIPACGGGHVATPFSATGSCAAFPGTSNNGSGCCMPAGLHPCTSAGDANCVQCQGNPRNAPVCTATEARFVQRDIDRGKVSTTGPDSPASCYSCLFMNNCLDSAGTVFVECKDGPQLGSEADCLAVVDCVLASSCSAVQTSDCYCGTAPATSSACYNAPSTENGACASQIAAALNLPVSDGYDIGFRLSDSRYAGSVADDIFSCAVQAQCAACLH